ncbi:DNA polymerase III subunit gamma/tau [Aquibaculum arenosum]|uniref:DNA polymerase III subunit gamma/tau n=1 Tax=Aquibaculum arenosum TaxID=3032591 RepID=A0ABT5YI62_9PROT|nr:DNA polymerase III subunit gamma/tau [Fodinicurvata sp. CAU 1616]MDF2094518.1 DNA polymerase III subunit gamma/tau [Fodinicurvata sp. CAU 1616]
MSEGTGPAPAGGTAPYRVLARKYRPQTFADLIGQDALVRTLSNAIETGRLPHAIVLTGVRGVGKTTTARIIAKAINYAGPDGSAGPTTGPTDDCPICQAIAEDRLTDVLEMDAASRTGVNDIRELIEGVRYRPTRARYKVYIIDEVHMLSTAAFNALLKTLEEPPPHVVFIFATTEIRKVPVTVLSRCMRFDLRRVDQTTLAQHFARICEREAVSAEPEALNLIARAADGSVRDGLSLLDQAMAVGEELVQTAVVKEMLGLADRSRILELYDAVMRGEVPAALESLRSLYDVGADPVVVLQDMLEITHTLTRLKLLPQQAAAELPENERVQGGAMAEKLSVPALTRNWQFLLKGISEAQQAPQPLQAAEMVLIRLAFAAELPTPGDLVRRLSDAAAAPGGGGVPMGGGATDGGASGGASASLRVEQGGQALAQTAPEARSVPETKAQAGIPQPQSLKAVVDLARKHGELRLAGHLRNDVHLVRFEAGRIELNPGEHAPRDLTGTLGKLLTDWTGSRWVVSVSDAPGQPSLTQQEAAAELRLRNQVLEHPLVQAVLEAFPGAELARVSGPMDSDAELGTAVPDEAGSDMEEEG